MLPPLFSLRLPVLLIIDKERRTRMPMLTFAAFAAAICRYDAPQLCQRYRYTPRHFFDATRHAG